MRSYTRLEEAQLSLLKDAIVACANNRTHMASYIGVSIKTVYNWLKLFEGELGESTTRD